ncbi:hypothetical protein Tco_1563129 [Tanacetum coccineum]
MSTSNNSNQQTLADSGANERPLMLEKGNYSMGKPMIPDPDGVVNINGIVKQILETLFKMTERNKKQYIADVKVMNYLLQAIPNDIYNSVDACKNAKEIWERIKRLMLLAMYDTHVLWTILTNLQQKKENLSINTKFLNCLQPEWSKYVAVVRHNQTGETVSYDMLYDSLVQFETHVLASKSKKSAKNHDPLALIAHSNASSSQSHANSFYLQQPYYVTHLSSVVDYEDEYQGELQGGSQKDKLITAMMLLARAITQKFSTSTNNRLRTSTNTRNQAVIQDYRVDIQTKNSCYGGNGNKNAGRQSRNQAFNAGNGNDDSNQIIQRVPRTESTPGKANAQCYNFNEKGHYARDSQKPRVRDANYFREQMLFAMKDEARSTLNNEENDFMLDTSYADGNAETVPSYDAKAISEVNASSKGMESVRYGVSNRFDMAYREFLGVGTTFDIFQNIHLLYLQYCVLVFSGYGVLIMFPSWSLVSAGTDMPYLP